ncbi:MAG: homoserine kinase [Bacilli bacterium]
MRITVTVPATSGNVGPGFDAMGLALALYNQFEFEPAERWEFVGFSEKYRTEDNMVVRAFKKTFEAANVPPRPFRVALTQCIPIARGLGSSASCIVAGVTAANYYLEGRLSARELLNIAAEIEGHPDNVAAAFHGSLICAYEQNNDFYYVKYPVCESLLFTVAIPNFTLPTAKARAALPDALSYDKITYSLARAINIPDAMGRGEIDKLFFLLDDRLHQPYRLALISESQKFRSFSRKHKIPFWVSGGGPALVFVSKQNIDYMLQHIQLDFRWQFITLKVDQDGTRVREKR